MKKKLLPILALFVATASAGLFTACGDGGNDDSEPHVHELVFHEFKDWNCTEDGNNPYYSCKGCDACFADESMTTEYTEADFLQPATGHSYYNGICSVSSCGAKDPNYVNGGFTQAQMEYAFTPSNYENLRVDYSDKYTNATIEFSVINGRDVAYVEMVDDGEEEAMFIIYDKETETLKTYNVVYENEGFDGEITDCVLDETATDTPVEFVEVFFEKPSAILNHYYTMEHDEEYGRHTYYIEKYKNLANSYVGLKIYMDTYTEESRLYKVERYSAGTISRTTYYSFYDEPQFSLPPMIDPDHVHDYAWGEVLEDATCTEEGVEKGTCECNATDTRPIGAKGHDYSEEWTADKTYHWHEAICGCEDAGVTEKAGHTFNSNGYCTECEEYKYTNGLSFTLTTVNSVTSYYVSGIGLATDQTEIIIPPYYSSYPVGGIKEGAFTDCANVTKLVIPETVTQIQKGALAGLSSLETLVTPFVGGEKNYSTDLDSKQTLEDDVFGYAFGTSSYTGAVAATQLFNWYSSGGGVFICDRDTFYIPASLRYVTVTGGNIPYHAFGNCWMIQEINLTGDTTTIGYNAFGGCNSLRRLTVPATLKNVGDTDCPALEVYNPSSATLNGAVATHTSLDEESVFDTTADGVVFCEIDGKNYVIGYVGESPKIELPQTYKGEAYDIYSYAFACRSDITSIVIPENSVTEIGNYAFRYCKALKNVTIPKSVTKLSGGIFGGCASLESMTLPFVGGGEISATNSHLFGFIFGTDSYAGGTATSQYNVSEDKFVTFYMPASTLRSVTITRDSLTSGAFSYCSYLTSIDVPDDLTAISAYAFSGCTALTEFDIPDGVTSIGAMAFNGCESLKELVLPAGVTSIGAYAFADCDGLTEMLLPENVENLGAYAFDGCINLESVNIPAKITKLSENVFHGCYKLTDVIIEGEIQTIAEGAFWACSALKKLVLPVGVESIERNAFLSCDALAIYYEGTAAEWAEITIDEYARVPSAIYYYSVEEQEAGSGYWHYDTDGKTPVLW